MCDKYRYWRIPGDENFLNLSKAFFPRQQPDIQLQVLKDLAEAKDEIEKYEILDSYAAYAQRVYQRQVATSQSKRIGELITTILEHFLRPFLLA